MIEPKTFADKYRRGVEEYNGIYNRNGDDPHTLREQKRAEHDAATVLPTPKYSRENHSPVETQIRNFLTIANNERALGAEAVAKARQMLSQYRNCGWQIVDEHFAALETR